MRVLSSTAVVGLPETRLGIIPGAGGTYRLPALIGLGRARDMILTGRRVTAAEAYFLGIADRLVEVVPKLGNDGKGEESKEDFMKLVDCFLNESCTVFPSSCVAEHDPSDC